MLGRRIDQEEKTTHGQLYNICGRCLLAIWFTLSPVLGPTPVWTLQVLVTHITQSPRAARNAKANMGSTQFIFTQVNQ